MATSTAPVGGHSRMSSAWLAAFIGIIPLVLLPTVPDLQPFWKLPRLTLGILGLSAAAYVAAIALVAYSERRDRPATFWNVLLIWAAVFMPVVLAVPVISRNFPRTVMLCTPLLALGLLWLAFSIRRWRGLRLTAIVALALIAIAIQAGIASGLIVRPKPGPSIARTHVDTTLYDLEITSYQNVVPNPFTQQGGITRFGKGYLLATGDSDLFVFQRPEGAGNLALRRLPMKVPLNSADFAAAMTGLPVALNWFRVADVLAQATPRGIRLFASHHFWKKDEKCYVVRVSTLEGTEEQFLDGSLKWQTLFDTSPCLSVFGKAKEPHFVGLENGGRLALLNDHELLLSVGDHSINGVDTPEKLAQDPNMLYGKIVHIDLDHGESRVFSLGHRNPQGLTVDNAGRVWSTEHGPRGGDELNLIQEGGNYGWPEATFGVDYGKHVWPLTKVPGSHDGAGFTQPFFSWSPGIGVSNLLEVDSPLFEYWRGDLLVGSLINRSLWRLRVRENRVVLAEPIPIGERIRDIIPGHRGELVLWTDHESIMFVEPAPQVAGSAAQSAQQMYSICVVCHTVQPGQPSAIGPDLEGVVGRRVASVEGFQYSPALRAAGGVWTRERLDAFLQNPAAAIPGTTMTLGGIPDAGTRRDVIELLASPQKDSSGAPGSGPS